MDQRYELYKDSGVQWLGEIPSHWKLVRIKALLEERTEKSKTGTEEPLSMSQKFGIIPTKEMDVVPNAASSYIGAKNVYVGDIVFNKLKAHLGVFAISQYEGLVSPDYAVYYSKGISDKRYIEYQFHTPLYIQEFKRHATGVAIGLTRLYTNQLYAIQSICPPLEEQKAIVLYLDDKCKKIDEWVNKKEKEVEHLQELKQRVVANAVTLGLNPDVKMKATNMPWLPEVPEHWEIKPIRSLLKESDKKTETGTEELLSLSQYTGVSYKRDVTRTGMFEAESTVGYKKVHPGQFVMNIMLAWNGSYAVSDLEGVISPAYCVFDFICECDKTYYDYLLRTKMYASAFKTESRGIIESRLRLYPNKFYPFHIPVPPIEEQHAIVSYISDKANKIIKLIVNINKEIETIKEYKQRLISDVITGQIKVNKL